jgi:hypothetical protein
MKMKIEVTIQLQTILTETMTSMVKSINLLKKIIGVDFLMQLNSCLLLMIIVDDSIPTLIYLTDWKIVSGGNIPTSILLFFESKRESHKTVNDFFDVCVKVVVLTTYNDPWKQGEYRASKYPGQNSNHATANKAVYSSCWTQLGWYDVYLEHIGTQSNPTGNLLGSPGEDTSVSQYCRVVTWKPSATWFLQGRPLMYFFSKSTVRRVLPLGKSLTKVKIKEVLAETPHPVRHCKYWEGKPDLIHPDMDKIFILTPTILVNPVFGTLPLSYDSSGNSKISGTISQEELCDDFFEKKFLDYWKNVKRLTWKSKFPQTKPKSSNQIQQENFLGVRPSQRKAAEISEEKLTLKFSGKLNLNDHRDSTWKVFEKSRHENDESKQQNLKIQQNSKTQQNMKIQQRNFLGVRPSQRTAVEIYAMIWTLNFFEKSQTKYETSCFSESFSQKLFNFCHALINVNLGRSATN